jgi:TPR repeat protein
LGYIHENGFGVDKDYDRALAWYRKSSDNGDALARYMIGLFHYHGRRIPVNYTETLSWMHKALANGETRAENYIKLIDDK